MKICVIGSCGKRKRTTSPNEPTCEDLQKQNALPIWREKLHDLTVEARSMYTGNQNRELCKGVDMLREITGVTVDFFIISAGFGFLKEHTLIPPYECSFSTMTKPEIQRRSRKLGVISDFRKIASSDYDLFYMALGRKYITALGDDWFHKTSGVVLAFDKTRHSSRMVYLPAGNQIVKRFSNRGYTIHGAAGFKGDLLRILALYALEQEQKYAEVMDWKNPLYLQNLLHNLAGL
ncbi:MAG: hypothetical protein KGY80_00445 [Candidatus Thorarchaeota archaeon]|nr:hypothetical protein [Candidatus Thorarchaeota archaeon]